MSPGYPGSQVPAEMVWMSGVLRQSPEAHCYFLKQKGTGHITYLYPASSTKQHSADSINSSSFHLHNAVISLFPLPQCLSGKMLLVSFDGNSATQVKSPVLFSSFVVTTTSEFNSAACFSTRCLHDKILKSFPPFYHISCFQGFII